MKNMLFWYRFLYRLVWPFFCFCHPIRSVGRENIPEGPVVFVANHQGYFDIPLMLTQLDKPNPIVAKKEIMKVN